MSVSERWRKLKRVFCLTARGVAVIWRLNRGYTFLTFLQYALEIGSNYWHIFWSARLLNEIVGQRNRQDLLAALLFLLIGSFVFQLLMRWNQALQGHILYSSDQNSQMAFADKIIHMDYALLEQEKVHTLYRRVERESYNERKNLEFLRTAIPDLLANGIGIGIGIVMVKDFVLQMWAEKSGLFFLAVVFVLTTWLSSKMYALMEKNYMDVQDQISENCLQRDGYNDYLQRYEHGKEIRIYQMGSLMIQHLMSAHAFNDRALEKRRRKNQGYYAVLALADGCYTWSLQIAVALAALAGKIAVGSMLQYVESVDALKQYIARLSSCLTSFWYNAEYLERYFTFFDLPNEMKKGRIPVEKRVDGEYEIEFSHVSFRYPGSESYALKDLNLKMKVGEKMAVVGRNGSGKSTFIKLLCRLYDPTEGEIRMNGIDIRRYQYEEYLSLFSVVFQDFQLFSFDLAENVAVSEVYEEQKVEQALKKAGLQEFMQKHRKCPHIVLYRDFDQEGVEVSGGEAQKIALARAIYKGAPFVLLDEPTAALDPLAEYEIYRRFHELVADRTTIFISHRMSSCRFCGDIAVFDEGQMVQRGSHEELMRQRDGKYYELWSTQAQYYQQQESEQA